MVFAFPAYHEEERPLPRLEFEALADRIDDALDELGWLCGEDRGLWSGTTPMSLWSWGERIEVEVCDDDRTLRVKSSCQLPTQCVDFGRNRRNVLALLALLDDLFGDAG